MNQIPLSKVCSRCNQEKPITQFHKGKNYKDGYMTWCKECHREYYRQPEQRAKLNRLSALWADRNKDHVKERHKEWYEQNKERVSNRRREYDKERWATNQEVRDRKNRQKNESTKKRIATEEGFLEKFRAWRRDGNERRRARRESLPDTLTKKEWEQILEEHHYACHYCGTTGVKLEQEHKLPLSRGGPYTAENIVPCCEKCNRHKHNKTEEEFLQLLKSRRESGA